jgi:hypothetical protein
MTDTVRRGMGRTRTLQCREAALGEKSLGLLHELQPGAVRVGCSVVPER